MQNGFLVQKIVRFTLLAAIGVFGLLLSLRALFGPLSWPVRVNSPLNAAGICGLAVAALLALRYKPEFPAPGSGKRWGLFAGVLPVLIAIAYARAVGFYFLSDDFIIVQLGRTFHFNLKQLLTTAGGDGFFRPMGYVSLALTSAWAGLNPVFWHATTLAIHVVNSLLVLLLAGRLLESRRAAAIAAMLFAIHGTRPEVAVWIAGRFDLVATFFVLAGLVLFLREGAGAKIAAFVCMVLGILSKESAYVFPLLLALLLSARGERKWRSYVALAPFFAVAAGLFAYRWVLFGGMGGYPGSFALLPSLKALGMRIWAALFFPVNWGVQPGTITGGLMLAYVACLLLLAAQRTRFDAVLPVGFVLLASLPPLNQLLIAADLQKSRMLYLPSVGFCLLLGAAIAKIVDRRRRWVVAGVVLAFHLAALEHNLGIWETASVKVRRACAAAAQCGLPAEQPAGLPGDLHGAPFFANGFMECAAMNRTSPAPSNPGRLVWDPARGEFRCERSSAAPARPR